MATLLMQPSEVFRRRLRETRKARGLSQAELADQMTAAGQSMHREALLRVENGTRRLSLDEALAFAQVLAASPANLLSPPEGAATAPIETIGYDGAGLRQWLATGSGGQAWPGHIETADDRALAESWFEAVLSALAAALLDAHRAGDKEGVNVIGQRIVEETRAYLATADAV